MPAAGLSSIRAEICSLQWRTFALLASSMSCTVTMVRRLPAANASLKVSGSPFA